MSMLTTGTRTPDYEDRTKTPYTDATIMEIQRVSCVAPAGLEHRATEDIHFQGYNLKKGWCMWKKNHPLHAHDRF